MAANTHAGSSGPQTSASDDSGPRQRSASADGDKPPQPRRGDLPATDQRRTTDNTGRRIELEQSGDVRQWVDLAWLRARLAEAVHHVNTPVNRVGVCLVDDDQMQALHRRHLGIDETTDVLTFPMTGGPSTGKPIDVEIVVCVDEAFRRGEELGHCAEQELLLYALHGVLHAAGFDDLTDAGFEAMHAEEDRILEAIGVGRTFERAATGESHRASASPDNSKTSGKPHPMSRRA